MELHPQSSHVDCQEELLHGTKWIGSLPSSPVFKESLRRLLEGFDAAELYKDWDSLIFSVAAARCAAKPRIRRRGRRR